MIRPIFRDVDDGDPWRMLQSLSASSWIKFTGILMASVSGRTIESSDNRYRTDHINVGYFTLLLTTTSDRIDYDVSSWTRGAAEFRWHRHAWRCKSSYKLCSTRWYWRITGKYFARLQAVTYSWSIYRVYWILFYHCRSFRDLNRQRHGQTTAATRPPG